MVWSSFVIGIVVWSILFISFIMLFSLGDFKIILTPSLMYIIFGCKSWNNSSYWFVCRFCSNSIIFLVIMRRRFIFIFVFIITIHIFWWTIIPHMVSRFVTMIIIIWFPIDVNDCHRWWWIIHHHTTCTWRTILAYCIIFILSVIERAIRSLFTVSIIS